MDAKAPIIFLLLCNIFSLGVCCNVNTFNNNSVTLVGAKSIKFITGCFEPNEALMNVCYIQVVNETVPVLRKDAIHGLPKLLDVILEHDHIVDIEPGAFHNLSKLYLLKIRYNEIKVIKEGVFNNLTLQELCLTDNKIEIVHPNAFDNMPNLTILFLNENKISTWSSEWFKRSPQVSVLNFEYNVITTIPFRSLQNINGELWLSNAKVEVTVLLNDNKIRKIEDGAFEGIDKIGWLFLHRNEIEDIGEESLGSLKSVEWVRLDNNRLKCVPAKLVKICPKVIYYLYSNPLTSDCKDKYSITVLT